MTHPITTLTYADVDAIEMLARYYCMLSHEAHAYNGTERDREIASAQMETIENAVGAILMERKWRKRRKPVPMMSDEAKSLLIERCGNVDAESLESFFGRYLGSR